MVGHVPLARRNLLADRRRLLAGVLGVGLALMLTLLLDGLWEGVKSQATVYVDRVGADLFVTQPGVKNFLGETSILPSGTVDTVRATPGVDWAAPVRGQFVVFDLHGRKVPTYLVGSVPGEHGGPWSLADGRRARRDGEVVVDQVLARRHGLGVGDTLELTGQQFRIVGTSRETSAVMTGFVFVTHRAAERLLKTPETTSYVLVGTREPSAVRAALEADGLTVFTRRELAENDRKLYTGIFGSPLRLMVAVAFVAGVLVTALTIYASVAERRREYGIVKALGASGARITGIVIRQTLILALVGLAVGLLLFVGARTLIAAMRPQFSIVLTTGGLLRGIAAALIMGLVAALAIAGVGVALLLVLVLDGIFAGAIRQVTAYLRNVPADVVVSQRGVRTMHMSASALTEDVVRDIARTPGVAWAEGIRFTTSAVRTPTGGQLSYVIGYDIRTGRGGPWQMRSGRAPGQGEVVIDGVAADQLGVGIGGTVSVLGKEFEVSGLSAGGTSIINTTTFMRTEDFAALRGSVISYVLVGADRGVDGEALAARLTATLPAITVQTKSQIVQQEGSIVRDMSADIMQIMSIVGFLIALAVIALTLFTATLSKLREYAVVKALGASGGRLVRTVVAQALWSVFLALGVALVLTFAVAALVANTTPNIRMTVEAWSVARVGLAALTVGAVGAIAPLRRLLRLDPATAFRS